ncbi:hypothetical protein IMW75_24665 [Pseudomonas gregormendelii]|uniref:Flagellar hook-length control protein FliK n=1 Tax=Pseudomonas gregormendelii TaxID=1628277 RepID=A0ABS3AN77_9PSED|nr:hypothetical protein [Pseudomonas gregormendelii]MBN3968451.1 hypothetical protein [Pseudomonas gregormendelii]
MSTSIPAPVTRPVEAVLPVDEPGEHAGRPPVTERDESRDLPEGVVQCLAQLQPLPEPLSRPSAGLRQARSGAPEKISVAVAPRVPTMPEEGASKPMKVAGGPAVAMAVPALAQPLARPARAVPTTPATQLPALPGGMRLPTSPSVEPALALFKTSATQLPAPPAAMPLPMSDVPGLPGSASAALTQSPAQPVPANGLPGAATTASPTPLAEPGAKPGSTLADRDTPPPQSAQPLPPGLERTARAQTAAPPAAFNPPPTRKAEVPAEKAAQPYLQVPFSKGDSTGVVTINKAPADMPAQLLLSPSNAQVSGHLRDGLELAPQTVWQLNEQHEQAHDERRQHEAGDDETPGDAPQPLAPMLAMQGMKP